MPQTSINHAMISRFTSGPATFPEVHSSLGVGVRPESAGSARKLFLRLAIALVAVAAARAGSAAVSGIHAYRQYSCKQSSSTVQNYAVPAPGLDPFADAHQILNGNATIGTFSFGNDLLGNVVIDPSGKVPLLPGKYPELALCSLYLLQLASKSAASRAHGSDVRAGMPLAVRVGGDIGNSKVYAQKIDGFNSLLVSQVDCGVKIKFSLLSRVN